MTSDHQFDCSRDTKTNKDNSREMAETDPPTILSTNPNTIDRQLIINRIYIKKIDPINKKILL